MPLSCTFLTLMFLAAPGSAPPPRNAPPPKKRALAKRPADLTPRPARPARRVTPPRTAPPRPRAKAPQDRTKKGFRWPGRIGPFELKSQNGRNRLRIGFAGQLQVRARATRLGEDDADDEILPMLRRIRLILLGSFLTKRLRYYLQLSTAPKSLEIMDFYLDFRFARHLRVRAGQYKIPFSSYREGSFKSLTFVDWSILVPAFGSERQLGVHLHNDDHGPAGWFYAFGVYTGQNARGIHARLYARTWGERLTSPSDLTDPAPIDRFHPELVARLSYRTGGINVKQDTDFRGGGPRLALTLGMTWDLDPERTLDQSLRLVTEVLFKARHASLHAAFYLATGREDSRFSQRLAMLGGLVQTSYLFARRYELSARYALVHFDQDLLSAARLRAGDLIAAEPDPDLRAALEAQYAAAGTVQREHAATLGFNVYLIRNDLKVQLDVSWLGHERASGLLHDVRSRLQLTLAF